METARCIICGSNDKWKNVDKFRLKPVGMALCQQCGMMTYPKIISDKSKLTEYYEEEYRKAPGWGNMCSAQRKMHFHGAFLKPLLDEWKEKQITPDVFEIGAAFGSFLYWMRSFFPKGTFSGTELTKSFVRNAYWLYGLNLKKEFDTSKQYDLIASYKVAEHMIDADKEIEKYAACLKPGGKLYISIPAWFDRMSNFGAGGFDIEYYYSTNHINCWTRKQFEYLLAKYHLKIVKEDHAMYDDTYLCEYDPSVDPINNGHENVEEQEKKLEAIFNANEFFKQNKYEDAIKTYPNFPLAWSGFFESNRAKFNEHGYEWIIENVINKAIEACPNSFEPLILAGDISMRYSEWEKALGYFERVGKMRPNDPKILMNISNCFRHMAQGSDDIGMKFKFLNEAREITKFLIQVSQEDMTQGYNWLMADNAKIPTPHEKA